MFDPGLAEQNLAFASGAGSAFTVRGLPLDEDMLTAELGVEAQIGAQTAIGISYSGQLGDDAQSHAASARLIIQF